MDPDGGQPAEDAPASGKPDRTGTPTQKRIWKAIEAEADQIVTKSTMPLSRAKAICEAMKKRPDLVAKYYAS